MALKPVTTKVQKYIPKCEKESSKPTTICFKPMNKATYDEFIDSLTEFKKNKLVSKAGQAAEILFKKVLHPDESNVIIYNAMDENGDLSNITDKELAVKFLLNLGDIETANEIEQVLRGSSVLEESEEKNSGGQ